MDLHCASVREILPSYSQDNGLPSGGAVESDNAPLHLSRFSADRKATGLSSLHRTYKGDRHV